ncbi:YigZ family protein [Mucilaginibacter limnophilus]|uniref:YigZ family protein n=1 Tax=Mucilaginibacter limnophilus TaxID=1932778 RepID=A0A3S2UNY3_9SPHI|nr:YigZ family protein [Mucilaginibacter limnophilus]RVU00799.1 YigZ family protein [Mucilaginibacter limnophilus]
MLFDDTYNTIDKPAEGLFTDRGSKFIAYAYPITTDSEVKTLLQQVKTEHPKARHHCWAMRLTPDRSVFRINDDGEPSGTAGRPILNTMLSHNITNVFIVVVRYFGGTLLGVPGLINAYKTAANEAVKNANVISKTVNDIYQIEFDYLQMNEIMRIIKDENLNVIKQEFDNQCAVTLSVRQMQVNTVTAKFGALDGVKIKFLYSA